MAAEIETTSRDPSVDLSRYSRKQYKRIIASGISIVGTAFFVGKDTLYLTENAPLPYRIGFSVASIVGATSIVAIEIFNSKAEKAWKLQFKQ